jgi:hypothetical protein
MSMVGNFFMKSLKPIGIVAGTIFVIRLFGNMMGSFQDEYEKERKKKREY